MDGNAFLRENRGKGGGTAKRPRKGCGEERRMSKPRILVSACLLGVCCRYNAERTVLSELEALMERAELIPVCPETLGGLPTPRPAAERRGGRVINCAGVDVTQAYARGAEETLRLAKLFGVRTALMKERSPSCGAGEIYDGSFSHVRVPGDGVAAQMLRESGVAVYGEGRIGELMEMLKGEEK